MGLLPTVESITKHTRRSSDASSINASGSGSPSSKYAGGGGGGVGGGEGAVDGRPDDVEVLDKEEGNIVLSMISQLRIGMDLSKITFPTFVLEPRSMLERITDFMAHPDLMFGAGQIPDPKQRFLQVTALILAGWHIKPKGVKKPYNPVLGEFFRCTYTYPDGSEGFYIAEQVSHHPPVSAFFYVSPKNQILVTGELKPKSKFLGNSVATVMEGENRVRLLDRPEDGEYTLTMPNMFARGILYGKMMVELGDTSTVTCPKTDFSADIEWKTKGWISGGYNAIAATVRGPSGGAGEISGHWDSVMDYKDKGGKKQTLFDATKAQAVPKAVAPETEQEPNESRRLWAGVTRAIKTHDMEAATTEKAKIEDAQRDLARKRESSGQRHQLRFFQPVGDKYMPKLDVNKLPKDPEEACRLVREFIFAADERQAPSQPATPAKSTTTSSAAQPSPVANTTPAQQADNVSVGSRDSFASATDIPIHETAPGPPAPGPKIALDPN